MLEKLLKSFVKPEDVKNLDGGVGKLLALLERQAAAQERVAALFEDYIATSKKAMGILDEGVTKKEKKA